MISIRRAERGQALVLMVFALMGLLVIVGLTLDGGMAYLERRRMQNSADAGSLAGTRLLAEAICGDTEATDAAIAMEVNRYAESNGVKDTDGQAGNQINGNVVADYVKLVQLEDGSLNEVVLGRVGDGTIPEGALGISTTVAITNSTYFVSLIGINTAGAAADALAVTAPPLMGGGMLPIGVYIEAVKGIDPGEDVCIMDSETWDESDGILSPEDGPYPSANRGWLNLDCIYNKDDPPGCRDIDCSFSNAKITGWIDQSAPFDGQLYPGAIGGINGDWVRGDTGVRTSAFMAVEGLGVSHPGITFYAPIFDVIYKGSKMMPTFPDAESWFQTRGGPNAYWYHVVGFIGIQITSETDGDCPGDRSITATFVETIMGEGMPNPSAGVGYNEGQACLTHTQVVTLWR